MKVSQSGSSQLNKRKNILGISKTEHRQYSYLNSQNYVNEEEKMNLLNMPLKFALENGGRNHNIQQKRNYKDLFLSNIGGISQINNNNISNNYNNIRNDYNNINNMNYSFYNEPSLINKIKIN